MPSAHATLAVPYSTSIGTDLGLKQEADSTCHSLSRMCLTDVAFCFGSWDLDMGGEPIFVRSFDISHMGRFRLIGGGTPYRGPLSEA